MKKFIALFAAFAAFSTLLFADWANYGRYANSNEEVKASKIAPIAVFMGDSITDGWSGSRGQFFTENNYVGRGISGQVTTQMLARFQRDVVDLKPKVVLILAGTNDIARNQGPISLENIAGNIQSMCEIAKANKIKPVICSILPAAEYGWRKEIENVGDKIIEVNKMLQDYAKKNKIAYLDYHSKMVDERKGLPLKYSKDGVHPTAEGYAVMEEMAKPFIEKVAKSRN